MKYLQWSLWAVGLGLQYLTLSALLATSWREFWPIVVYLSCLLGTTVGDILFSFEPSPDQRLYFRYYYIAEFARQTALYAVVTSLVLRVLPPSKKRGTLIRLLVCLAIVFWAGSLLVHKHPMITHWMNPVIRNLSFSSALANMILWLIMIASEKKDNRLLMITGALGIQMTGDAIGQSLIMQKTETIARIGQYVAVITHFICLYVWWQAFQVTDKRTPSTASAATTTSLIN